MRPSRASTCCPVRYAALLRFCTNYAYRFSPADETVAIRSQDSTCTLAVAAAYVPYVVAKLLQMMLLNYTCLNYASPNLRFAYTGMQI